MKLGRIFAAVTIGVITVVIAVLIFVTSWRDTRFEFYVHRLDGWVNKGGVLATLQSDVVENCGKLVLSQATPLELGRMITVDRSDFHFRVDVCTKMTVNRVNKQPEFNNEHLVTVTCAGDDELFPRLCARSGLLPVKP